MLLKTQELYIPSGAPTHTDTATATNTTPRRKNHPNPTAIPAAGGRAAGHFTFLFAPACALCFVFVLARSAVPVRRTISLVAVLYHTACYLTLSYAATPRGARTLSDLLSPSLPECCIAVSRVDSFASRARRPLVPVCRAVWCLCRASCRSHCPLPIYYTLFISLARAA